MTLYGDFLLPMNFPKDLVFQDSLIYEHFVKKVRISNHLAKLDL